MPVTLSTPDSTGTVRNFVLDEAQMEAVPATVDQYTRLCIEQAVAPVQASRAALQAENERFRDKLASEVMRVEMLTWPKGEDDKPKAYDAEARKKIWLSADADLLTVHYDEALRRTLSAKAATTEGTPPPAADGDDPYATT